MNIKHDKIVDAKYISIKKGKISYTKKDQDWLFIDYSKEGEVLGLEILNSSKNSIFVYTIKGKFAGFEIPKNLPKIISKENKAESKDNVGITAKLPTFNSFIPSFKIRTTDKVFA